MEQGQAYVGPELTVRVASLENAVGTFCVDWIRLGITLALD
jgi:hypothetical protein